MNKVNACTKYGKQSLVNNREENKVVSSIIENTSHLNFTLCAAHKDYDISGVPLDVRGNLKKRETRILHFLFHFPCKTLATITH